MSLSLERFGDRWSLLLIRDMMVRGFKTFKEFEESGEGIATNILADKLKRLQAAGIVEKEPNEHDRRRSIYRLTEKGIDLAPVMLELLLWASKWEEAGAPCEVLAQMGANRGAVLEEVRRRWRERIADPFLPAFGSADTPAPETRRGAPADSRISKARCGAPAAGGDREKRIKKGEKR